MEAAQATGASPGEAVVLVAQALGAEVALGMLLKVGQAMIREGATELWGDLLDEVAESDPDLARGGLGATLGNRLEGDLNLAWRPWILALPEGLEVSGDVALDSSGIAALPEGFSVGGHLDASYSPLAVLPDGLRVGGSLNLRSTSIKTLPPGLVVGRNLTLMDCSAWDGRIPDDTVVNDYVFTDRWHEGITLADWRQWHGQGEV
jgi:hypothetical protein